MWYFISRQEKPHAWGFSFPDLETLSHRLVQIGRIGNSPPPLICIDLSSLEWIFRLSSFVFRYFIVQCVGSRTDSKPTVDQSDMRGLVTA